jgi:rhodanese-related sulfurtransferase
VDNTWASGLLHQPLTLGADISILAATKYLGGHADVMMGAVISNARAWNALERATVDLGQTVGADDAYLVLRGMRTLPLRMAQHARSALRVADFLLSRPEVARVLCPALPGDPSHALWQRDCTGANGLLTVEFAGAVGVDAVERLINSLQLFGIGASWGGFESLVIPVNLAAARSLPDPEPRGAMLRLHVGLEDPDDLIADLKQALSRLSPSSLNTMMLPTQDPSAIDIDPHTLKQWLHDGAEIALLDVREHGQYGEGHLFYAAPVPYSRLEVDIVRLAPRRDVRIALYDNGGADDTAARAAQALTALGYCNVHRLSGGIAQWQRDGYAVFAGVNVPSKTFGELAEEVFHTPRIGARDLAERQRRGDDLIVLDGRPYAEYQKMSIPGGICCPNGELALRAHALASNPQTTIVVNCAGRTRSIIGAQTLINLGVPNPVYALENGTQGWYLEDLQLEHGARRRYDDGVAPQDLPALAQRSARLAESHGVPTVSAQAVQAWLRDKNRSTFLCDVRSAEEHAQGSLPGAQHTPGGQLIQATDQYLAVRGARIVVFDAEGVRAPVVASWLRQMGWDASVLREGVQAHLDNPVEKALAPQLPLLDDAQLAAARAQGAQLIDLRPSMRYRASHIAGARWSIRPRLASLPLDATRPVVLLAEDAALAAWAAQDLRALGVNDIHANTGDPSGWAAQGIALASTPAEPADADCIDYLFFVHDRHDGNKAAARQYLAWETNLVKQIDERELAGYRFPAR